MRKLTFLSRAKWIVALVLACGDKFPLPDSFDAAFVTGNVCMPTQIATGSMPGPTTGYPIRFETCIYRCVTLDEASLKFNYVWACVGSQCQMQLLLTAHVQRVGSADDCDARLLPDPPAAECTKRSFSFDMVPPPQRSDGTYLTGPIAVTVPYLDFDQGKTLVARIQNGENPATVVNEVVGTQNYPARQFVVAFDPTTPATTTQASALGPETCHPIAAP